MTIYEEIEQERKIRNTRNWTRGCNSMPTIEVVGGQEICRCGCGRLQGHSKEPLPTIPSRLDILEAEVRELMEDLRARETYQMEQHE